MKKILIVLLALLTIYFLFDNITLLYFNNSGKVTEKHIEIYNADKKDLADTMISWGNFECSPLADGAKEWWIDTMIYTEDFSRLLAIVDVITDSNQSYNYSKWIYGKRNDGVLNFYACESTQILVVMEKTSYTPKQISRRGRKALINNLYYPFTFIERRDFWNELFIDNEEGIIKVHESAYREYLNNK